MAFRESHSWTLDKLDIVERYTDSFTTATKRSPARHFFDGFCGPGVNLVNGVEFDGSPLIALKARPPFTTCTFVDLSATNVSALKARTQNSSTARVIQGDCNRDLVPLMRSTIGAFDASLCLLDPEGADVAWTTVAQIAAIKRRFKVEQLILFPTHIGFLRLLRRDGRLGDEVLTRLTRMFGTEDWLHIYERRLAQEISTDEATTEYVRLYGRRFETVLGYKTVLDREIRDRGHGGRLRYFMIFATDHPAGKKIMDYVFDHAVPPSPDTGQGMLFPVRPVRRKRLEE